MTLGASYGILPLRLSLTLDGSAPTRLAEDLPATSAGARVSAGVAWAPDLPASPMVGLFGGAALRVFREDGAVAELVPGPLVGAEGGASFDAGPVAIGPMLRAGWETRAVRVYLDGDDDGRLPAGWVEAVLGVAWRP